MKRISIIMILLFVILVPYAWAYDSGLEVSNYKDIRIVVEELDSDARQFGFTEKSIETKAELQLRRNGIIPGKNFDGGSLYINLNIVALRLRDNSILGYACNVKVAYFRPVTYVVDGKEYKTSATVWEKAGMQVIDDARKLKFIDKYIDMFILEYLRANQK